MQVLGQENVLTWGPEIGNLMSVKHDGGFSHWSARLLKLHPITWIQKIPLMSLAHVGIALPGISYITRVIFSDDPEKEEAWTKGLANRAMAHRSMQNVLAQRISWTHRVEPASSYTWLLITHAWTPSCKLLDNCYHLLLITWQANLFLLTLWF